MKRSSLAVVAVVVVATTASMLAFQACAADSFGTQDGGGPDGALDAGADVGSADGPVGSDGGVGDAFPGPVDACVQSAKPGATPLVLYDGFCIDSTEVTVGQYQAFVAELAQNQALAVKGPGCGWKTAYALGPPPVGAVGNCNQSSVDQAATALPVRCVDWCDAYAYCAWAGKRLCGGRHGGSVDFNVGTSDPASSEWFAACSGEGARPFAFGATCDPASPPCAWKVDGGVGPLPPAGSEAACVGAPPGLHDMNGSVWEWEYSCTAVPATGVAQCHSRGGSFGDTAACDAGCTSYVTDDVNARWTDVGFRCCWP